jgi:hypothetical protein
VTAPTKNPKTDPPNKSPWEMAVTLVAGLVVLCVIPSFELSVYLFAPPKVIAVGSFLAAAILLRLVFRPEPEPPKIVLICMACALIGGGAWATSRVVSGGEPAVGHAPVEAREAVALDGKPTAIAEGTDGTIWIAEDSGWIQAVNSSSRRQVGSALKVGQRVLDLAAFGRFIFASLDNGELIRLDPGPSPLPTKRLRYGQGTGKLTIGGGSIWVADQEKPRIVRVDPKTMRETKVIALSRRHNAHATALSFGSEGHLWVVDAGLSRLYKIDAATNALVFSEPILHDPEELIVAGKLIFVAYPNLRLIERIDATTGAQLAGLTTVAPGPIKLGTAGGLLFVIACLSNSVESISIRTGKRVGALLKLDDSPADVTFNRVRAEGWIANASATSATPLVLGR